MDSIREHLWSLRDADYRAFQAKLIPTVDPQRIIGVRTPALRAYAKELRHDPHLSAFLNELPHDYYDEDQLHAILLNNISKDIDETLAYVEAFLPYIDNWATCDMLSIKLFAKHPEQVYANCLRWLKSEHCYTVRFAIDVLLQFHLDETFRPETLDILAGLKREEYYINMALAWYMSYALIKQYSSALPLFLEDRLDTWLHNKSIQKAVESRRLSPEIKDYLRSLRR